MRAFLFFKEHRVVIKRKGKFMKKKKIIICLIASILVLSIGLALYFTLKEDDVVSINSKNVNHYVLDIDFDNEKKSLKIKEKVEYINNLEDVSLKTIDFHNYTKAFCKGAIQKCVSALNEQKAYYNGVNYAQFKLEKTLLNGEEITPNFLNADKDIISIKLKDELMPNRKSTIEFEYAIKLPNINHRFGYGENTINLGNFFLIASVYEKNEGFYNNSYHYNGDPFYSDISNFDVSFTCDSELVVASTGKVLSEKNEGDKKTTKIQARAVRDFAMILSDKFKSISKEENGVKVTYYYFDDKNPEKSLQTSVDSVKTFSEIFGKYPYSSLNVCESDFVYGGMEYPNLVFISSSIENYDDYTYTIIHEVAHQWWYGIVGNNEYKDGFLDESLAEYSVYIFFEENENYGFDTNEMINNTTNSYLLFLDVYREVFTTVNTNMQRSLDEFNTEPEYTYMAYVKGTLMFNNLKQIIGKNKLYKSLQTYFKNNAFKNAKPEDLISSFVKVCGKDMESYFKSWLGDKVVIENL